MKTPFNRPKFDDLPVIEELGLRHATEVFGSDDNVGTINLLTPDRVVASAGLIRTGTVFNLTWPMDEPNPPLFGRETLRHEIFGVSRNELDDRFDNFYPQASSQWDGLRHVRCREYGYYNGVDEEFKPGPGRLGVEHWVEHGIVGRGVLIDVARHQDLLGDPLIQTEGRSIGPDEISAVAGAQGVELRAGDVLCVRLGWESYYEGLDKSGRAEIRTPSAFPGLAATEDMARFLWNNGIAAAACDNPTLEVWPGSRTVGSLHRRLIPCLGMAIGEFFRFDGLSSACFEDGRWDFMFVSIPLHVRGAVGSPANAIAIR
jgi:kynurenine formamidase